MSLSHPTDPVMVKPTTGADPQEGHAFMLACKGSGPGITTVWYKDNEPIAADQRIWLSENHAMLAFSSLLSSDGGYYECKTVVTNSTIRVTSRGYQLSCESTASSPHLIPKVVVVMVCMVEISYPHRT